MTGIDWGTTGRFHAGGEAATTVRVEGSDIALVSLGLSLPLPLPCLIEESVGVLEAKGMGE
jgi:hypothetical protein